MKLIVGLGNPGPKYDRSRHNIGFWVIDRLARRRGISFDNLSSQSVLGQWESGAETYVLAKPQTFMNRSGESVQALLRQMQIEPVHMTVVYDDLDLPFSRIRVRGKGGAGGHRGIQSIIDHIQTDAFTRVRIGIGRPPEGVDPAAYVLEPLDAECLNEFAPIIDRGTDALELLLAEGIEQAMREFNRAL